MSSQAGNSPMAQEVLALSESGYIQQVPGSGASFSQPGYFPLVFHPHLCLFQTPMLVRVFTQTFHTVVLCDSIWQSVDMASLCLYASGLVTTQPCLKGPSGPLLCCVSHTELNVFVIFRRGALSVDGTLTPRDQTNQGVNDTRHQSWPRVMVRPGTGCNRQAVRVCHPCPSGVCSVFSDCTALKHRRASLSRVHFWEWKL